MFRDRLGRPRKADWGKSVVSVRLDHLPPDFPIQARDSEGHIWLPTPSEKLPIVSARDGRIPRETKNCQHALRRLGASRIWTGFNGNWPAIEAALQENLGEMMTVLGRQYNDRSAWSRAKSATARLLTKFNI